MLCSTFLIESFIEGRYKAFPSRGLLVSKETVELVDGGVTQY